jgi:hypothetical protein
MSKKLFIKGSIYVLALGLKIAHLDQSCFQKQRNCTVVAILVGERDCRTQQKMTQ